jgi:hypothetical protein
MADKLHDTLETEVRAIGLTLRESLISVTHSFNRAMGAVEKAARRWEEEAANEMLSSTTGEVLDASDDWELAPEIEKPGDHPGKQALARRNKDSEPSLKRRYMVGGPVGPRPQIRSSTQPR